LLEARQEVLRRHRWLVFVLPFAVFMLVGSLEPGPDQAGGGAIGLEIPYSWYPLIYGVKILATIAAVLFVTPGYREFPFRVGAAAWLVGLAGGVVWIGLCGLDLEHGVIQPALERVGMGGIIGSGDRAAYNPFDQLGGSPGWAAAFLAVRLLGLVVVVPVIEEAFLRGFLMRFVMAAEWWKIPFGRISTTAAVAGTAVPMLMHPGELLAAAIWFSLVTVLMVRTRNFWDCVAAHATTNLMLGVWVLAAGDWRLW
jgi:hypothetical protein